PALELRPVPDAIPGDVVEVDLAYELGSQPLPHELLVRLPAARLAGAALPRPIGLEEAEQLPLLLRREARRVADHVQLVGVVVQAEDERADRALLLAHPERHDDRVGRPHALDLQHADALAGAVLRARLLRDHA